MFLVSSFAFANLMDWRFRPIVLSLPFQMAPNLTNAGFQREILPLIKFFFPDEPCLKAAETFYELEMFPF